MSILIGLATSGFLAYAGLSIQRRPTPAEDRLAVRSFSAWWYAASLVIVNQTLRTILAVGGVEDVALYTTLAYLGNLPLAIALACLMYYILFLLTGRRGLFVPIMILYAAYFGYLLWYTARVGGRRLQIGEWQAQLVGDVAPTPAESVIFGVLLAAPILIMVVAYAALAPRVKERTQRYRLLMVSGGFLLLFGIILVGFLLQWNERPWFPLAYQIPALLASLAVVWAYRPPGWVQRWLHVEPVERAPRPPEPPRTNAAPSAAV